MVDVSEGTRHGNPATVNDNNPKLNTLLDDMRDAGMLVTKRWHEIWFTAIQYAWGAQLQGWKLKKNWQYVVVNRIFPLMFQTIAKLSGNNPKIMTHVWDDEKTGATQFAERWAGHLQYLWESPYELNMRLKLIKGLLDCALFGYMVGKTQWDLKPKNGWDNTKKEWIGKAREDFIHPAMFWTDPTADTVEEAENCGTTRRTKLEYAINKWPGHDKEFEASSYTSKDPQYISGDAIVYPAQKAKTLTLSRQDQFSRIVNIILNRGTVTGENIATDAGGSGGVLQKYVDIEEIYWNDYTEKKFEIGDNVPAKDLERQGIIEIEPETGIFLDPATKKPYDNEGKGWPQQVVKEYSEPKFPKGRFVLRVNKTILNPKEEDQVYKESRWPFTVMPYHVLPHMWQGGNAVEQSRNNNDFLNITVSSMVNQVRRTADPTKVIEAQSLAKDRKGRIRSTIDSITGLGRIIIAAKGRSDKIRNLEYPPLDAAVPMLAAVLKQDIDDQMFMQDVARGAAQKGQQTKAEIVRLNQNALDYVSLQGVFLDGWIDNTMTLVAELGQRNYSPGRLMKILNNGDKSGAKATKELLDVMFDVNIVPGSTLPFDEQKKQGEYATAFKMLENPIPNPLLEDMLRILNIAKVQEVLAKHQGVQLFRQFIQMGQLLNEAATVPEVQKVLEQVQQQPLLKGLIDLLSQAGQLAPQMGEQTQKAG